MHSATDLNCGRGYEWELMRAARARNPDILLYGLPWGFPAFLGDGDAKARQGTALSKPSAKDGTPGGDTVDYIVSWVGCATRHNLTIDILGVWNEMDSAFAASGVAYISCSDSGSTRLATPRRGSLVATCTLGIPPPRSEPTQCSAPRCTRCVGTTPRRRATPTPTRQGCRYGQARTMRRTTRTRAGAAPHA
jgi:hypothetical protein